MAMRSQSTEQTEGEIRFRQPTQIQADLHMIDRGRLVSHSATVPSRHSRAGGIQLCGMRNILGSRLRGNDGKSTTHLLPKPPLTEKRRYVCFPNFPMTEKSRYVYFRNFPIQILRALTRFLANNKRTGIQ
jgi:hypothetical protein